MGYRKLQIKRLSDTGELLRCVNCHAGQVTVLRAMANAELTPFQRALSGIPGAERFSLTLDGEPFEPSRHSLVGFGETFPAADTTAIQYLINMGVLEGSANSLLLSYGLDSVMHTRCSDLSEDHARRLRIIGATTRDDKILVINNPFEVINSQWKERFAELVASFARLKKQIVVIPSLAFRPQHWIDNELISRIQVGENIQKTIGFASGSSEMMELIKEVRADFAEQPKSEEPPREPPPTVKPEPIISEPKLTQKPIMPSGTLHTQPQRGKANQSSGFRNILVTLILGVLIGVSLYGWLSGNKPATSLPNTSDQIAKRNTSSEKKVVTFKQTIPTQEVVVTKVENPLPTTIPVKQRIIEQPPELPKIQYVLDLYPKNIREAVILAFDEGTAPAARPRRTTKVTRETSSDRSTSNLFSMLESVSGTGEKLPDRKVSKTRSVTRNRDKASSLSEEDIERRRELIRQKFLEAIERHKSN